jgi:hypothetical protein
MNPMMVSGYRASRPIDLASIEEQEAEKGKRTA